MCKLKNIKKILFSSSVLLLSLTNCSDIGEESDFEKLGYTDTTSPTIKEVTKVTTPTNDSTPNYTFSSDEAGTISYGGTCTSTTTSAISGNNTITLSSLDDGTYSDCSINVTDNASNISDNLTITTFIVDSTAATLTEVYAIGSTTIDNTPTYTFYSDTSGTISYGGSCSSSTSTAISGNNTITLSSLSDGTYSNCTITVTDSAGNAVTLNMSSFTVSTGSSTIEGGVISYSNSSPLSDVTVSYILSSVVVDNTSTDSNGDFTKSSLASGTYTLSYSKTGYVDENQSATLSSSSEILTVPYLKMLSTSCSSTGTISGTITDAMSSANVSGVSVSIRRGLNTTSGSVYATAATTDSNGDYSFNNVERGWYTLKTSLTGYSDSHFNVVSCGDVSDQDSSIITSLTSSDQMYIILRWPKGSAATDLDSHIQIPDNDSNDFHLWYGVNVGGSSDDYYYYGTDDNASLDRDNVNNPGTETITIQSLKSGTYSYSVHNFTDKAESNNENLTLSGASVEVKTYSSTTTYYPPLDTSGNLWHVFTYTTSGGLVEVGTMSDQSAAADVY